jgi:hypothetical protein
MPVCQTCNSFMILAAFAKMFSPELGRDLGSRRSILTSALVPNPDYQVELLQSSSGQASGSSCSIVSMRCDPRKEARRKIRLSIPSSPLPNPARTLFHIHCMNIVSNCSEWTNSAAVSSSKKSHVQDQGKPQLKKIAARWDRSSSPRFKRTLTTTRTQAAPKDSPAGPHYRRADAMTSIRSSATYRGRRFRRPERALRGWQPQDPVSGLSLWPHLASPRRLRRPEPDSRQPSGQRAARTMTTLANHSYLLG